MIRLLVLTFLIAATAFFTVTNASLVETAVVGLRGASLLPLAAGVSLSVVAMMNRGLLNRATHRAVGLDADRLPMARTAAVGFAANKIVKSGGAAGLAVFVRHGRHRGYSSSTVTASCLIAAVASFAALGVLLTSNIALLAVSGNLSGWWLAVGAGFATNSLVIAALGWMAMRRRARARLLWARGQALVSRVVRRSGDSVGSGLDELYDGLLLARENGSWSKRALVHALLSKALGAGMLWAAALAAGIPISLSAAVAIYTAALAASLVSIVPGGVGVVEASIGAMFVSAGAPVALAAVAVALFRIFDLWLPVVAGAIIGRHDLRARAVDPSPAPVGASEPLLAAA